MRIDLLVFLICFGSYDEKGGTSMGRVKPREIRIVSIHDVEVACFRNQGILYFDVMHLSVGNMNVEMLEYRTFC